MPDEMSQAIQSHGQQIDFIAAKVVEQDERLARIEENMVTKTEHQDVMKTLDKLVELVAIFLTRRLINVYNHMSSK
jgi:hypothetical protein